MQFTQIQDEIIERAHCEGKVDPAAFADQMAHDPDDVHAAANDLVNRGLMTAAEGGAFRLTDKGEAVHGAQEEAHRAAVISSTRTWQPR